MKKSYTLIFTLLLSGYSHASDVNPAKITQVLAGPSYGNQVLLTVSPTPSNLPSCQNNQWYSYVFDGTTEAGKITLSLALAAYAANKNVWLGGTGVCTLRGGVENLKHIVVK